MRYPSSDSAPARHRRAAAALLLLAPLVSLPLTAQQPATRDTTGKRIELETITVTATRNEKRVFATPAPVSVVDSSTLRRQMINSASDLFRDLPGLDVTGVGPSQTRPSIRGQRGQRILLLEDGIRMNNSRRQQDFGELPSLVDPSQIERVEVVRGPASVLYGTDAIGGVVNLITLRPPFSGPSGIHGSVGYQYSSSYDLNRPTGMVSGRMGRLGFRLGATHRQSQSYTAPSGSFGDLTLARDTRVHDTGVEDQAYDAQLGYALSPTQQVEARYERYQARDAGFGYVNPSDWGSQGGDPFIQILYPSQFVDRYSASYRASGIGLPIADKLNFTSYYQSNQRTLHQNIFIPFGNGAPPDAGVQVNTRNYTDLNTLGLRAEATKVIAGKHLLTYGFDAFRDHSENTDFNRTAVVGFGPPQVTQDSTPQIPNATYRSAGVFVQGDLTLTDRLSVILGSRYQDVHASPNATPGIQTLPQAGTDRTVVGAANVLYRLTDNLNLVAAVGRGFRSPNLVERFFNGPTPEGSGYQSANPALKPETSINVDLGAKYRYRGLYLEAFVFRNEVHDGIRIAPTGDSVSGFPEYQNVNIDKLRYTGVELLADLNLIHGFSIGGNYTHLSSKDVLDPGNPVGETYSSKIIGHLRYRSPEGRFWGEYTLRHNGRQKDVTLGTSPVGPALPAFTVQDIRAGARLFNSGPFSHAITVSVENLTDRLYAESANVSFFRPEPGRRLTVAWTSGF
ncbi:MAG: TonB-dependent receptor plug domain-containing protein [Gemmatimonadales bacterium]